MAEHTKEPWKVDMTRFTVKAKGKIVVCDPMATVRPEEETIANLKRIALCVNACAGISNEALESGMVYELIAACKATISAYDSHQLYDKCPLDQLKAAVAKATGQ